MELQGEWLGATAGGCINHPTWRNNPQYFLFMRQTATVTITLVQDGGDDHSVGFYVVKVNRIFIFYFLFLILFVFLVLSKLNENRQREIG